MIVQLNIWTIPRLLIPKALGRVAIQRFSLNRQPSISFHKTLGTGSGTTFTTSDADLSTWALLTCHEIDTTSPVDLEIPATRWWSTHASRSATIQMTPLSSHGLWSGRDPFPHSIPERWDGPIAALTRARIHPRQWRQFWSHVPPVAADLHDRAGLMYRIGIGEAPIGLQGTFSIWRSNRDLNDFAHRGAAHRAVITETQRRDWYAEELFARFAIRDMRGDLIDHA